MRARDRARVIDGIAAPTNPETGWRRRFDGPIPLPDGGELRTLLDAGRYVDALPRSMHEREEWKTVMEVLGTLRYSIN
jgi:hypothetical protein